MTKKEVDELTTIINQDIVKLFSTGWKHY
jgi:hypothetical protein